VLNSAGERNTAFRALFNRAKDGSTGAAAKEEEEAAPPAPSSSQSPSSDSKVGRCTTVARRRVDPQLDEDENPSKGLLSTTTLPA
jgi:hypothetical protein